MKRLSRKYFQRPTLTVAKDLVGEYLIRMVGNKKIAAMITETEAYCGEKDLASHARFGPTPRGKIMWGPAGYAYIYMVYGVHFCLNIVTEKEGRAGAVLIRGVTGLNGPGKLCKAFKIDKKLNGKDTIKSRGLWIEKGPGIRPRRIIKMKRVGIDYAGKYKDKLWRFVIESKE